MIETDESTVAIFFLEIREVLRENVGVNVDFEREILQGSGAKVSSSMTWGPENENRRPDTGIRVFSPFSGLRFQFGFRGLSIFVPHFLHVQRSSLL